MDIGIIGSGKIGSAIARALVRIGQRVTLASRRGPGALAALVQELGPQAKAGTVAQAAAADLVFVAVNWSHVPAALQGLGDWADASSSTPTTRSRPRASSPSTWVDAARRRCSPTSCPAPGW